MAFCTNCGSAISGVFCGQCGVRSRTATATLETPQSGTATHKKSGTPKGPSWPERRISSFRKSWAAQPLALKKIQYGWLFGIAADIVITCLSGKVDIVPAFFIGLFEGVVLMLPGWFVFRFIIRGSWLARRLYWWIFSGYFVLATAVFFVGIFFSNKSYMEPTHSSKTTMLLTGLFEIAWCLFVTVMLNSDEVLDLVKDSRPAWSLRGPLPKDSPGAKPIEAGRSSYQVYGTVVILGFIVYPFVRN